MSRGSKQEQGNKMKAKILGFTGKKGVGKNFVADIAKKIVENGTSALDVMLDEDCAEPIKVEYAAFADPMKEFLVNICGLDKAKIYGNDKDKNSPTQYRWEKMPGWLKEKFGKKDGPVTIRHAMQIFGTELNREIWDQNLWVNAMKRRAENSKADWFFITDCRYQNEIDSIKEMGGIVLKVDGHQRGDEFAKNDGHSSEKAMDSTVRHDYTVFNGPDDTPESLEVKIRLALKKSFFKYDICGGTGSYGGPEDLGKEFGGSDF